MREGRECVPVDEKVAKEGTRMAQVRWMSGVLYGVARAGESG